VNFLGISDVQEAWNLFYHLAYSRLECIYPIRTITITSKDPEFMTSEIKSLLRCKNRLMRRGHVEKAESLGKRVTKAIKKITSLTFTGAGHKCGTKALWDQVSKHTKKSTVTNSRHHC